VVTDGVVDARVIGKLEKHKKIEKKNKMNKKRERLFGMVHDYLL